MRLIATVLNIALIGTVIYFLSAHPPKDLLLAILFLAAPITSLLAFRAQDGEDWLSLFFRRKTLEERKKIERLNNKEVS